MNKYITFKDEDKNGELQYYILQREFPHYVGLILLKPKLNSIFECSIPGYNMWVSFGGTLEGNKMPSHADGLTEVKSVCLDMVDWFLENRIKKDIKRYKKWQFNPHLTIS